MRIRLRDALWNTLTTMVFAVLCGAIGYVVRTDEEFHRNETAAIQPDSAQAAHGWVILVVPKCVVCEVEGRADTVLLDWTGDAPGMTAAYRRYDAQP